MEGTFQRSEKNDEKRREHKNAVVDMRDFFKKYKTLTPKIDPKTVLIKTEGKNILLQLENGNTIELNETGLIIWKMINGKRTVAEMLGGLLEKFEIEAAAAQKDLGSFLQQLEIKHFILTSPQNMKKLHKARRTPIKVR
jgi:hypothetical protein